MQNAFFKSQKVTANGYCDIEIPLPNIVSKLHCFLGLLNAARWLLGDTGSWSG